MEIVIKSKSLRLWEGDVVRRALTTVRNDISRKRCAEFSDDEFDHYLKALDDARARIQNRAGPLSLLFSGVVSVAGGFSALSAFAEKSNPVAWSVLTALLVFAASITVLLLTWVYLLSGFDKAADEMRAYWKKLRDDEEAAIKEEQRKKAADGEREQRESREDERRKADEATKLADEERRRKLDREEYNLRRGRTKDGGIPLYPSIEFKHGDLSHDGKLRFDKFKEFEFQGTKVIGGWVPSDQSLSVTTPEGTGVRVIDETQATPDDTEEKEAQTPDPPKREERKA